VAQVNENEMRERALRWLSDRSHLATEEPSSVMAGYTKAQTWRIYQRLIANPHVYGKVLTNVCWNARKDFDETEH